MRIYLSLLSLALSLLLIPTVGALTYPSTTPTGEVGSGTFNGYFTNMFNTSGCTGGQVLRGFTPTGVLLCTSPTTTQYWTSTDAGVNIYFTGAGNVGIQKTTPQAPLDVNGEIVSTLTNYAQFRAIYGNYGMMIRNDSANTYFLLTNSGSSYGTWNAYRPIVIGNADSTVALNQSLYSLNNGNVGIGTIAPTAKLEVAGLIKSTNNGIAYLAGGDDATINDVNVSNTVGIVGAQDSTKGALQLGSNAASYIAGSAGNIGIGTVSPTNKFQIGINPTGWTSNDLVVSNTNGGVAISNNVGNGYVFGSQRLDLYGNGVNTMSLLSGNVGISNTTPNAKLTIGSALAGSTVSTTLATNAGTLGTTATNTLKLASLGFLASNNASLGIEAVRTASGTDWSTSAIGLKFDVDNTSAVNNSAIWLNSNGNIGIGTSTPSQKLDIVGGGIQLQSMNPRLILRPTDSNTSDKIIDIIGTGSSADWRFYKQTRGTDTTQMYMTIQSSGNVGIGTSTPGAKLDIAGTIKIADGTQGTGKILTSDAVGLASWVTPGAATSVPWTGITGAPVFAANATASGRVRMYEVGCESGYGTSCDANTNGRLDLADSATWATNVTALAGTWDGINYFRSNKGAISYLGANTSYTLEAYSNDGGAAAMSFHRGGTYAVNLGLDPDNVFRLGGWSAPSTRWQVDMSGNETVAGSITAGAGVQALGGSVFNSTNGYGFSSPGDTDGGMFSPADGNLVLATDNTERLRINNAGNVGIGTATPSAKLDVNGPIRALGSSIFAQADNSTLNYSAAPLQVREAMFGATASYLAPRISLHWGGVVASQIGLESSGRIAILNNLGTGYENLVANTITANGGIVDTAGTRMDAAGGWLRTYGATGWFNGTYAGGFYMVDPTWIRSYNGKYLYVDSVIQAGAYMNSPAYYYISDARLKKDLVKITSSLDKITAMNGYYFKWIKDDKKDLGLIAQEVEKIFPDAVGEYTDPDSKKTYKNVEYGHLIAPVIEAIKELATLVKSNKTDIIALKSENESLKKRLDAIEARLTR